MNTNKMRGIVILLILVSLLIYGAQILVFRDANTTFFYIFQDFAFLPLSVAITTVVIGEMMNRRESAERQEKTRMLTSTFFTEVGGRLMTLMLEGTNSQALITRIKEVKDEAAAEAMIREYGLDLQLTEEIYEGVRTILEENKTNLMILSSNPMILEQECFTQMLWGCFHLTDEFNIRGDYGNLNSAGRKHIGEDMTKVLHLMLVNWSSNAKYLAKTYPDYYAAAAGMLKTR